MMLTKEFKNAVRTVSPRVRWANATRTGERDVAVIGRHSELMTMPSEGGVGRPPQVSILGDDGAGGVHIVADNLSVAWIEATDAVMRAGVDAIEPLVVTLTGFDGDSRPLEVPAVAALIDAELLHLQSEYEKKKGKKRQHRALSVSTVANTMFPEALWNPAAPRATLYATYAKMLPRLKRDTRNPNGLYFERLIAYGSGPEDGNQLEFMIRAFNEFGVKRKSAFQAPIVKPETDSTNEPYSGFPCLQQIAVLPSATKGTLAITGFYGTQYLLERAYGNFVGLSRIGRFLAHEMGLKLVRVTCVAGHATAGNIGKDRGRKLVAAARAASEKK